MQRLQKISHRQCKAIYLQVQIFIEMWESEEVKVWWLLRINEANSYLLTESQKINLRISEILWESHNSVKCENHKYQRGWTQMSRLVCEYICTRYSDGENSLRRKLRTAKVPFGKNSYVENSYGQKSYVKNSYCAPPTKLSVCTRYAHELFSSWAIFCG